MKISQSQAYNKNKQLHRQNKRLSENVEQLRSVIANQEDKYRVWMYVLFEQEKKKYENKQQILLRYLRESQDQAERLKEQLKELRLSTGSTQIKNPETKKTKQS